jgi:hypothetical protein
MKAAETDGTKRALITFGKPFGLELYRNDRGLPQASAPSVGALPAVASPDLQNPVIPPTRSGFHPDDTTPIPRPSRYFGQRQTTSDPENSPPRATSQAAPPLAPRTTDLAPGKIDKSQLAFGEPKRLRDKAHLKYVALQPCLICGRQPSDPHHLRFAQLRAIGMKVSDEFTVPLCRTHHRQLHQAGDEVAWWGDLDVNALEIARGLWEETHPKTRRAGIDHPDTTATNPLNRQNTAGGSE